MGEGTMIAVLIFPKPWPPTKEWRVLSRQEVDTLISLAADTFGRLVLSITIADQNSRVYRFQPMTIIGSGRAILSLEWSKNVVSIRLNGRNVDLEARASGEVFILRTSENPIAQGPLLRQPDLAAAKTDAEFMFLSTLAGIDQKVAEGSRYSLIRAAGLLRQLLLDATPLVHEVNRAYGKEIEFKVMDYHSQPPITPQAHWEDLDGSHFPGAATVSVNLDKLLRAPCLKLDKTTATVRDLILVCAQR
jgi:hypothetical protein